MDRVGQRINCVLHTHTKKPTFAYPYVFNFASYAN